MKIEIEVEDVTQFAKSLNNASAAYAEIVSGIYLGCAIPKKFEKLRSLPEEELLGRLECLKDVYRQVEQQEKGGVPQQ